MTATCLECQGYSDAVLRKYGEATQRRHRCTEDVAFFFFAAKRARLAQNVRCPFAETVVRSLLLGRSSLFRFIFVRPTRLPPSFSLFSNGESFICRGPLLGVSFHPAA